LKQKIVSTIQARRPDVTLLTAGQTAGGIKDIPPVSEIMRRLLAETEAALRKAANFSVAI
jgi:NAD(P)H-dependent flavin oxidoreductase YrpB (nitropropane dioxygenase family)